MRISELAGRAGVPVSTVRYYERIGLLSEPARTCSGYREYDDNSATQLLFVTRARELGLTCEQIVDLLPIWGGTNCTSTHDEVARLIDAKNAEIAARIEELSTFAARLDSVRTMLESSPPPHSCRTDLTCCVPSGPDGFVPLESMTATLGWAQVLVPTVSLEPEYAARGSFEWAGDRAPSTTSAHRQRRAGASRYLTCSSQTSTATPEQRRSGVPVQRAGQSISCSWVCGLR